MNNFSHTQKKNRILNKFRVLTRLMSKQKDINIVISGTGAYTTGSTIVLPYGDFEDKDYCELLEGLADHEIGHVDESDLSVMKKMMATSNPLACSILNIIEDVRMERSRCSKYFGSRINFYNVINHGIERGWFTPANEQESTPKCLTTYILYACRSIYMEQDQLQSMSIEARLILIDKFDSKFVEQIDLILAEIPCCKNTEDAAVLTREIMALLGDDDSDDDDSDDDNSDDDNSDDDNSDDDNSDDDNSDPHGEGSNSEYQVNIRACNNATEDETQQDFHEIMKEKLVGMVMESISNGDVSRHECNRLSVTRIDTDENDIFVDYSKAMRSSSKVRNALAKTLHDVNKAKNSHSNSGSNINASRLSGIKAGNLSVFKTETITRLPNTAISVLVDKSSSMVDLMTHTNTCTLALAMAFEKLKGVKSEILYYPFFDIESQDYIKREIHCAKSFDEKVGATKAYFNVEQGGSTPTGSAMNEAIRRLSIRKEPKKILFVITDGEANDTEYVRQEVENARLLNIDIVPIVLQTIVSGFEGLGSIKVDDVSQLHTVIKDAVKLKLL